MSDKKREHPLREVVSNLPRPWREEDIWLLEHNFETETAASVEFCLRWLEEQPDSMKVLERLCHHALGDPNLGRRILEHMTRYVQYGGSAKEVAKAVEHGIYKLGGASLWQEEVVRFAVSLADDDPHACDYLRYPAWSMLAKKVAAAWAPKFFRDIVLRVPDEDGLLAVLKDLVDKTFMPFEEIWPHVVFISHRIDGLHCGPSLLFAGMNSEDFLQGLAQWVEPQPDGSLSAALEDFRRASFDESYLAVLVKQLDDIAAAYYKIFSGRSPQDAAAIASFMIWKKVEWPRGTRLEYYVRSP